MATELTFLQQFALWAQICFYIVTGISVVATGGTGDSKIQELLSSIYQRKSRSE